MWFLGKVALNFVYILTRVTYTSMGSELRTVALRIGGEG